MSSWYGTARSNYFKVKDAEAFREWAKRLPDLGVWDKGDGVFGVYGDDCDSGGWPSYIENDEGENDEDFDLLAALAEHLLPGEVAVLMEAGAEKMRYVTGYAQAVDHTGKVVQVGLSDIYDKAKSAFGVTDITPAEF